MDQQPSRSQPGTSAADDAAARASCNHEPNSSSMRLPTFPERSSSIHSLLNHDTQYQHRPDLENAGGLSDQVRVALSQGRRDSDEADKCHRDGAHYDKAGNSIPVMAGGSVVEREIQDVRHVAPLPEPQATTSLSNPGTGQDHSPTYTAATLSPHSAVGLALSKSKPDWRDAPTSSSTNETEVQKKEPTCEQEAESRHPRPSNFGHCNSPGQSELPSQSDHGRPPLLSSPLTHPNGVSIFPNLSTLEQEQLAQEALAQAEESIVADSLTGSDTRDNESDGGYDSEGFSSASTSAESSVRDYMYENGRRYHRFREGHYNFPNDDVEQEREDMKHAMVKLLCSQKLHFAPIGNNPQEVLDIGTGTGIWAIEMGDQFPSAHILGIDLSPIQPDWLPPNVRFMVDDMESPWLHPRNHFDYIHSRHTVMAIKDWDRLYMRSYEHLKPGGWMEMQEIHHRPRSASIEGVVPEDHPVAKFWTLVTEGLAALGVNLDISAKGNLATKMQDAGFTSVTERVFHVPIGTWPKNKVLKTVGLYWRTILLDGLQAIALGPLTRGLHWNRDQVELFLMEVRQAYHDNAALMYMPLHIVYAQKPTTAY